MNQYEFEQIFGNAAEKELEAKDFYAGAAKKCRNPELRELFERFAKEEMGHFELLEEFRTNPTMMLKIEAPAEDWKVAETAELPHLSLDMKPQDAITLAMKKEQEAVEFYRALAASATADDVRKIFENLANMELNHKNALERMFVDVGYPEVF